MRCKSRLPKLRAPLIHEDLLTEMTVNMSDDRRIRVFVHLARGFGRSAWKQRWEKGEIVGINHDDPYGYRQAEEMGCTVQQSEDYPEGRLSGWLRLAVRAILGFDLVHAWRNRKGILPADVVWTHTESQSLSVLLLVGLSLWTARRPKVIAQTVWLIDSWDSYFFAKRALYRWLLRRADTLTFLSTSAAARAQQLFPRARVEFVKYGIRADQPLAVIDRESHLPVRILAMGNDRHRDWSTLIAAIENNPRYIAKVLTGAKIHGLLKNIDNVHQERASTNTELMELLGWADLLIVSLIDNFHASGITVIEEAVLYGIPVICTDVGGLRSYFSAQDMTYVPPNDPHAIRSAIELLSADAELRRSKAKRALAQMTEGDVNSRSFVARHVELSTELLRARRIDQTSGSLSMAGGQR